ncbi:MAG: DnaA/Hda family protein, partial [Pseudomonadota bacterium]
MTNETWGQVREELRRVVGKNNFSAWIAPIHFEGLDGRTATFHVPTTFFGSWVSQNFGDVILRHLHAAGVGVDRVEFKVGATAPVADNENDEPARELAVAGGAIADSPAELAAARASTPVAAPPVEEAPKAPAATASSGGSGRGSDDVPGSNLNAQFTFENFVVGKPNELAHAAARRVAEGRDVTFNPLFLYGGVGLGKTHLMHAIAHDLRANFPDQDILYLSAEQFMYRFVRALREQDTISFKQMFRSVDVLMVDDVQFIAGKTSTQEEFFHTFNALVEMGKQIVISGDRAPVDMEELDGRIASRLQ